AEAVRDLLFEAEPEAQRPSVPRMIPFGAADHELVLGVHVLGDERLDERAFSDHAVGMRAPRGDAGEQEAHGAQMPSHERLLRAAVTAAPSCCLERCGPLSRARTALSADGSGARATARHARRAPKGSAARRRPWDLPERRAA